MEYNLKEERDDYWENFYPSSKILYNIFTVIGWVLIAVEAFLIFLFLMYLLGNYSTVNSLALGVGFTFLLFVAVIDFILALLFFAIRESMRIFVDRNFYLYRISNDLGGKINNQLNTLIKK